MEAIIRIAEVLDVPVSALFENREGPSKTGEEDSEEFYRQAFNNAVHFILMTDPSGKILQANQAVLDFSGHTRRDLVGNSLLKASLWQGYESDSIWIKQGLEQAKWGNSYWNELTVTDNDGNDLELAVAISPVMMTDHGSTDKTDIELVILEGYLHKPSSS